MAVELRVAARYRLIDCIVVAERIGLGWWLLRGAASSGGVQRTWAVAPDGSIYQGSVEVVQTTNPATFCPTGPMTDLAAADLELLHGGPYGDDGLDRANRRTLG